MRIENRISILQAMESWLGSGNEATNKKYSVFDNSKYPNLKPKSHN